MVVAGIYCMLYSLTIPKFHFLLQLRSVNSLAMSRRESLSFLSNCLVAIGC